MRRIVLLIKRLNIVVYPIISRAMMIKPRRIIIIKIA